MPAAGVALEISRRLLPKRMCLQSAHGSSPSRTGVSCATYASKAGSPRCSRRASSRRTCPPGCAGSSRHTLPWRSSWRPRSSLSPHHSSFPSSPRQCALPRTLHGGLPRAPFAPRALPTPSSALRATTAPEYTATTQHYTLRRPLQCLVLSHMALSSLARRWSLCKEAAFVRFELCSVMRLYTLSSFVLPYCTGGVWRASRCPPAELRCSYVA
ncbi:hypothetical protein FB451DRAFT_1564763, partial [Mycena latifolia]